MVFPPCADWSASVYDVFLSETLSNGVMGTEENLFSMLYYHFPELIHFYDNGPGGNCAVFNEWASHFSVKRSGYDIRGGWFRVFFSPSSITKQQESAYPSRSHCDCFLAVCCWVCRYGTYPIMDGCVCVWMVLLRNRRCSTFQRRPELLLRCRGGCRPLFPQRRTMPGLCHP